MSVNVLFVCLGNICRSPTADGVFQSLVNDARLNEFIRVDSAGTAGWHQGSLPDARTIAAAKKRGYDLSPLRARQVLRQDFLQYEYILAMDSENLHNLNIVKPKECSAHLGLFLKFSEQKKFTEVPDPYHGNDKDFELVLDLVEDASRGLLESIRTKYHF